MSKKLGKKLTGMDITYRVVTALAAACVPVAAYFANMIYYVVESPIFALIAQFQGNTDDDGSTYGYLGFHKFVQDILPLIKQSTENKESIPTILEAIAPIKTPLIVTASFLAAAIVVALVIVITAIFSNSRKLQMIFSSVGVATMIGMVVSFGYFSKPIINGDVSLGSFFESALVSAILPYIASFSLLNLSSAWVIMLVIFMGILIWSVSNFVVDLGDEPKKPKASKKS